MRKTSKFYGVVGDEEGLDGLMNGYVLYPALWEAVVT